ncbi:MAG: hypothetical protein Q9215_008107 [Flavoplaca cf. flavocitrina]
MNSKIATLILGILASITLASPIDLEAATDSTDQAAASAGSFQQLAIEAAPAAAQDITYIQVCINGNLSGRCERLRNTKGNCSPLDVHERDEGERKRAALANM